MLSSSGNTSNMQEVQLLLLSQRSRSKDGRSTAQASYQVNMVRPKTPTHFLRVLSPNGKQMSLINIGAARLNKSTSIKVMSQPLQHPAISKQLSTILPNVLFCSVQSYK